MIYYKNPVLLSILSGVLLTLSWPVQGFSFLIFVSLIPLFFVEYQITKESSKRKKTRLFVLSYIGFFVWNLGTTWWIVNSSVFGMVFAIVCNSLFYAIVIIAISLVKKKTSTPNRLCFFGKPLDRLGEISLRVGLFLAMAKLGKCFF
jgi:apolipoprotein N-acyltransferase